MLLCAFCGSLAGDQLSFLAGRLRGHQLLSSFPKLNEQARQLLPRIVQHRIKMLTFRFVYGFRIITPFAMGLSDVPGRLFILLNAVGAALWTMVIGGAGYLAGQAVVSWLDSFRRYEIYVLSGLAVLGLTLGVVRLARIRRKP